VNKELELNRIMQKNQLKVSVMTLLDHLMNESDVSLMVFDRDQKTMKCVESINMNGHAIQLNVEWGDDNG